MRVSEQRPPVGESLLVCRGGFFVVARAAFIQPSMTDPSLYVLHWVEQRISASGEGETIPAETDRDEWWPLTAVITPDEPGERYELAGRLANMGIQVATHEDRLVALERRNLLIDTLARQLLRIVGRWVPVVIESPLKAELHRTEQELLYLGVRS